MNTSKGEQSNFWDNIEIPNTLKGITSKGVDSFQQKTDSKHGKFFIRNTEQTILLLQYLDKTPHFILARKIINESERNEMFENLIKYFNAEVI